MVYDKNTPTDLFGYVENWGEISRKVREDCNGTCAKCKLTISNKFDWRFLHVHHINGDKTDNRINNLMCLCIKCHAEMDSNHLSKISAVTIEEFIAKYLPKAVPT